MNFKMHAYKCNPTHPLSSLLSFPFLSWCFCHKVKLAISELKDRTGSSLAAIVKWTTVSASLASRLCRMSTEKGLIHNFCSFLCFCLLFMSHKANYYVPEDKCKKHAVVALKQAVAKKAVIRVKASYKLSVAAVKALSLRKRKEKQVAAPRVRTTKRRFPVSDSPLHMSFSSFCTIRQCFLSSQFF